MPYLKNLQPVFLNAVKSCLFPGRKILFFRSRAVRIHGFRTKSVILVLFLCGFLSSIEAGPSTKIRDPRLRSTAVIVQDQNTDEFLLTKKAEAVMPIASITKLMTAMVILDSGINMGALITIQESDKDKLRYSRSHLYVGTRLSRMQALLLALMASENRAAHALARTYPGGKEEFVRAMNRKARSLGLSETRFEDSSGLSGENVSSAQDLCSLVNAAYRYPLIRTFTTRKEFILKNGRRNLRFVNTNSLVRRNGWDIGLSKTGYIQESGRCLVMQAQLKHRPVVIVLLNASGNSTRINDVLRIKQWLEKIEPVGNF
ncbi:MAG: serine hydrolase [Acidobacteria bacterium]|nr:serine hydrolase [Acidobacteriota bacterium]